MSSANSFFEVGAVVVGYVGQVASWRRPTAQYVSRYQPMLTIQSCGETDEGVHTPASSVSITSSNGLVALRAAIDEALKEPTQ